MRSGSGREIFDLGDFETKYHRAQIVQNLDNQKYLQTEWEEATEVKRTVASLEVKSLPEMCRKRRNEVAALKRIQKKMNN